MHTCLLAGLSLRNPTAHLFFVIVIIIIIIIVVIFIFFVLYWY